METTKKDLWRTAVKIYCDKKGVDYKNPRRGSVDYYGVKKIYDAKVKYFIKHINKTGPK